MSTLRDDRLLFSALLGDLLVWCHTVGIAVTVGDVHRSADEQARLHAAGVGAAVSAHVSGLAVDLNLYVNGRYQRGSEAHRPLGTRWKSLHPLCRWGGDFPRPDGNHYSLERRGVS